ncbi:MAG: DUF4974 domain-containing protein [Ferruginibacter sp.]|nr:DUF4974 domain-containing protein [Cytophagales bacterium]
MEEEPWELIAKYLKEETSAEERERLFAWVNRQPENREIFQQLSNLWRATRRADQTPAAFQPDVERAWTRFKTRVNLEAAPQNPLGERAAKPALAPPAESARPRVVPFRPGRRQLVGQITRLVATVLLVLGAVFWVRFYFSGVQPPVLTQATRGDKRIFYLPDSSRVLLNRNSQLAYAEGFAAGKREVTLTGEAFFEVRKVPGKTFVVFSGNAKTEVLGTSFNVRAYPSETNVEVQVVTGRVAFSGRNADDTSRVYLTRGFKGELSAANALTKAAVENPNLLAWKEGRLAFNNTQLAQVVASLERYFNVPIRVSNPQLLACRFTGSFEEPDLEEILEVLKASVNLSYATDRRQYVLSGPGCR